MEDLIGRPDGKGAGDMPLEVNTLSQDEANFDDLFENDSFGDLFNSDPDGVNAADEITSQITGDDNGMPDDLTQDLSQDSQTVVLDEAAQDTGEDGFSQMGNDQEGPMEAPEGMEGLEDIFGDLFDQEDGGLLDEQTTRFGICERRWSTRGLYINGKETKLRGACIHHDNGPLGACEFPAAARRRVKILKDAGFNAIRSAHNPISRAMLDACDEIGMYVMDELADMWYEHKNRYDYASCFEKWHTRDLTAMVLKDISHPSVVMYSIGNEVTETAEPSGIDYARSMAKLCHELDAARPVTCGINMALNVMHFVGHMPSISTKVGFSFTRPL